MIRDTFLLKSRTAEQLYQDIAKDAPIYDYHCHLSAKEIYEDIPFSDISTLWLKHDHYKWRAMRYAGVDEDRITGHADGFAKFKAWAITCERLVGSPLYHWTNMELKQYFGVDDFLKESNAEQIYEKCNAKIAQEAYSPVRMIQKSKVKLICTTDDPVDTLEYHKLIAENENYDFKVLPTFRPDKAINIQADTFPDYMKQLSLISKISIDSFTDLMEALKSRIQIFQKLGCRLSDHSLESLVYEPAQDLQVDDIFRKRIRGEEITKQEADCFKTTVLTVLAAEYKKADWVMQLHIGAFRNTNEAMYEKLGVDAGFDIMNDFQVTEALTRILNAMNIKNGLPKTILYSLNAKDNLALSAIPHCFPEDGVPGKIQFGPAWWFNDNKEEIIKHLKSIANQGMLADFTGMLTDSRSLLSYVRHDYFRRILCSFLGQLVEEEEFEADEALLKTITEGICYKNIVKYLKLEE